MAGQRQHQGQQMLLLQIKRNPPRHHLGPTLSSPQGVYFPKYYPKVSACSSLGHHLLQPQVPPLPPPLSRADFLPLSFGFFQEVVSLRSPG